MRTKAKALIPSQWYADIHLISHETTFLKFKKQDEDGDFIFDDQCGMGIYSQTDKNHEIEFAWLSIFYEPTEEDLEKIQLELSKRTENEK